MVEEAEADRKAAEEDPEVLAFSDTTEMRTFHSLCYGVWREAIGLKLVLKKLKNADMLREVIFSRPQRHRGAAFEEFSDITSAMALAKNLGYIPDGKFLNGHPLCNADQLEARLDTKLTTLGWELLDEALTSSIASAYEGIVDYDDQVYMPALFGGTFPVHPLVVVDER